MTAPVREVKVKPGDAAASRGEGEVTVMTSYEARAVGGDCVYVLETSYTACQQVNHVIELVLQTGRSGLNISVFILLLLSFMLNVNNTTLRTIHVTVLQSAAS